jgi:hypothetical protein
MQTETITTKWQDRGKTQDLTPATGRISRDDKRGAINEKALPILERLNLDPDRWCKRVTRFEDTYQDYRQRRRQQAA